MKLTWKRRKGYYCAEVHIEGQDWDWVLVARKCPDGWVLHEGWDFDSRTCKLASGLASLAAAKLLAQAYVDGVRESFEDKTVVTFVADGLAATMEALRLGDIAIRAGYSVLPGGRNVSIPASTHVVLVEPCTMSSAAAWLWAQGLDKRTAVFGEQPGELKLHPVHRFRSEGGILAWLKGARFCVGCRKLETSEGYEGVELCECPQRG